MKRIIIGVLVISLGLLLKSCNTVEPDGNGNDVDTTSHNFTFQSWTFGEHSGSTLRDVAIINDTSMWAVGEIYLKDSLGQPDLTPYNAIHWNGVSWDITRIPTKTFSGTIVSSRITTIFAFNEIDIWTFSIAGSYSHWNGSYWGTEFVNERVGTGNQLWGKSSSDLYLVGDNGSISFYNGLNWQSIGSRTTLNINDIWGIIDQYGIKFILCPAYNFGSGGEKKLISISNNTVGEILWMDNRELYTVWFNTREKIYAGGEGLFYRANNQWKEEILPELFKFRVRGNDLNDIWTVGGFGFAAHYNGTSWKTFEEVSLVSGNYHGLAVKGNIVVMVGNEGTKAVITIGRRQ